MVQPADRGPEAHPAALERAYAILSWIALAGERRGLDGTRIALAGDAAGASLRTALALLAEELGGPALVALEEGTDRG